MFQQGHSLLLNDTQFYLLPESQCSTTVPHSHPLVHSAFQRTGPQPAELGVPRDHLLQALLQQMRNLNRKQQPESATSTQGSGRLS